MFEQCGKIVADIVDPHRKVRRGMFFNKPLSGITFEDLRKLVYDDNQRESVLLDYKSGVNQAKPSEDIAKDVSSFANHLGGYLVYGAKDNGNGVPTEISGIAEPEKLKNQIVQVCASPSNLNPPIFLADPQIIEGEVSGKKVACVVVKIDESSAPPHFFLGGTSFYLRNADTNQPVEGTPDMLKLLENRRVKTLEAREAQLQKCREHSLRWLGKSYGVTSNTPMVHPQAPCFSISLQPRLFNRAFHDIRLLTDAMEKSIAVLRRDFKWPPGYTYAYFDTRVFDSYALTWVEHWDSMGRRNHAEVMPSMGWSSTSSTGLVYHLEDMPYKCKIVPPGQSEMREAHAFHPTHILAKILAFLMFGREYFKVLEKDAFLDLRIEFYEICDMALLYHGRQQHGRSIIENQFVISKSFSTLQMDQGAIESLVIGEIGPEMLVAINYQPGHAMDANEIKDVKRVTEGR